MKTTASRHPITATHPTPHFNQGALLGNGGLGVVVCTRPDAVVLHFGHNAVWDIRHRDIPAAERKSFSWTFQRVQESVEAGESPYQHPDLKTEADALNKTYTAPYPRPCPCGTLILGLDRRDTEVLGWTLHIESGRLRIHLRHQNAPVDLEVFCDMEQDACYVTSCTPEGDPVPSPVLRIKLAEDPELPPALPISIQQKLDGGTRLSLLQRLPHLEPPPEIDVCPATPYESVPGWNPPAQRAPIPAVEAQTDPRDRGFRLLVRCDQATASPNSPFVSAMGQRNPTGPMERHLLPNEKPLQIACKLHHGSFADLQEIPSPEACGPEQIEAARAHAETVWTLFHSASNVQLSDAFLEERWVQNQYFIRCTVKPDGVFPGLYGNWMFRRAGSVWHGDYHMNYNTQQPTWGLFSSNHLDLHEAYLLLVEHQAPLARRHAQEYFQLPGLAWSHTSYPIPLEQFPPPSFDMGWEVCEHPWWVQSLWWHYTYSGDRDLLNRIYPLLRDTAEFLNAYLRRPEADFGDGKLHVFPTVPPELYCIAPDFNRNADGLADLTLIRFLFRAVIEAARVLNKQDSLIDDLKDALNRLPADPQSDTEQGPVFVGTPGEGPDMVYNCPIPTMTVFPGEQDGLRTRDSDPERYQQLVRTWHMSYNEGGNDLVHRSMQAARLGILDLEQWKRHLRYCLLPNGTCADMVMQAGGRYEDWTEFGFMENMGVWVENFAIPAVINECLLQSWDGTLRLFPNWDLHQEASFRNLRAVGGLLVSARCEDGEIKDLTLTSETGPRTVTVIYPDGHTEQVTVSG